MTTHVMENQTAVNKEFPPKSDPSESTNMDVSDVDILSNKYCSSEQEAESAADSAATCSVEKTANRGNEKEENEDTPMMIFSDTEIMLDEFSEEGLDGQEVGTAKVSDTKTSEQEYQRPEGDSVDEKSAVQSTHAKAFAEQEAMLEEYLEEERKKTEAENAASESAKPKRKSIAERLKNLPGNLLHRKPTIRPSAKAVIDLDEDFKTVDNSRKKGIEDLMNRFAIHTSVKKPPKEEHYKLHITRREEDSQGTVQLKTDEAEYVKYAMDEDSDEEKFGVQTAPGAKMALLKARLKEEMRVKRRKAMEEKEKIHAMYSDEKIIGEKDENEEEEILLDDDMSDSDKSDAEEEGEGAEGDGEQDGDDEEDEGDDNVDEDQEEDVEALLDGTAPEEKKKKRRHVFMEEEASESGGENSGDENEEAVKETAEDRDFIDDQPLSDEETDAEEESAKPGDTSFGFEIDGPSQVSQKQVTDDGMSQDLFSEVGSQHYVPGQVPSAMSQQQSQLTSQSSPIPSLLDPSKTPKLSAAILNHRSSPLAPWNNSRHESSSFLHPGSNISPLIPRLNSSTALEAFCEENETKTPKLTAEVAKLVGNNASITPSRFDEDELEGLCSARFPSQQPTTPQESQEFDCFGFDEDDSFDGTPAEREKDTTAPPSTSASTKMLTETPKTGEKVARTLRLNFQDAPAELEVSAKTNETGEDEPDSDDEVIGMKVQKKRKRKLEFSDDEATDDEQEQAEEPEDIPDEVSEDDENLATEDVDESEKEYDENEEEVPKFKGFVSTKTGKIRRDFVEAEAELSGSEEGSGDEDEHGLDEYEVEAGDEEEIDESRLREQVGKAHLKQVLDDDQREINFLQEVFFEDGDLHSEGQGRVKKFRWGNSDTAGFAVIPRDDEAGADVPEDELDKSHREQKKEMMEFLQKHYRQEEMDATTKLEEETSQKLLENSQLMKLGKKNLRKIEKSVSMCETSVEVVAVACKNSSPQPTFARKGSFLQRESTLTKLAEIAKINDSMSKLGAGKGFVFTMVTPPNDPQKAKGAAKRAASKPHQPKKMLKPDPSLNTKGAHANSIFKWM